MFLEEDRGLPYTSGMYALPYTTQEGVSGRLLSAIRRRNSEAPNDFNGHDCLCDGSRVPSLIYSEKLLQIY